MDLKAVKNLRELHEELDYWRAYTPNSVSSNMLRIGKNNSIKNAIASSIEI